MASFSGLQSHYSVSGHWNGARLLPLRYQTSTSVNTTNLVTCTFTPKRITRSKSTVRMDHVEPSFAMSRGGSYDGLKFDEEYNEEPFWSQFVKETIRALKSLLAFLVEQPGQLKYIEWPSFQETLRTAILTLVIVAMLIVALSAVDSALSFMLALILRRPA